MSEINTNAIKEKKRLLRKEVLKRRDALTETERKASSLKLADRIIGHQWFYRSDCLLIFASYGSEIDTSEIISEALRTGKRVYLPKVEGEEMQFYKITSLEELTEGYRGIPEPDGSSEKYCYYEEEADHTLMIMPGVAFDPYRNRIGYGKGFYDRFLADKEALKIRTIAVGFQCQMVEEIPQDLNDIIPYQVILA
ncbi:MAG: 5-formyltetrahydrofolate cyclo-ligase [Lachnospiraceae bacterium]|nr:5-formyltetrahydrofolate cyclo-ligase [Lachnospiraceae bacterium]